MGRRFASICRENWLEPSKTGMGQHFKMCGLATGNKERCPKGHTVQNVEYLVLCSIVPFIGPDGRGLSIQRSYGTYYIPATSEKVNGGKYQLIMIEDAQDLKRVHVDLLSPPDVTPVHRSCQEIVKDIIQTECYVEVGGKGNFNQGVFVCAGDKPTAEEIAAAQKTRDLYLTAAIQFGDEQHAQAKMGRPFCIHDWAKRAAIERNEQREWIYAPAAAKTQCEGCGTFVELLADGRKPAVCVKCGAPINRELAMELGLWAPPVSAPTVQPPEVEAVTASRAKAKK